MVNFPREAGRKKISIVDNDVEFARFNGIFLLATCFTRVYSSICFSAVCECRQRNAIRVEKNPEDGNQKRVKYFHLKGMKYSRCEKEERRRNTITK